jgi:hypothetical protein
MTIDLKTDSEMLNTYTGLLIRAGLPPAVAAELIAGILSNLTDDMTPEDYENMGKRVLQGLTGVKKKYDDTEPRDPDGKWSGSGAQPNLHVGPGPIVGAGAPGPTHVGLGPQIPLGPVVSSPYGQMGRVVPPGESAGPIDFRVVADPGKRAALLYQGTYEGASLVHQAVQNLATKGNANINLEDLGKHPDDRDWFTEHIANGYTPDDLSHDVEATARWALKNTSSAPPSTVALYRGISVPTGMAASHFAVGTKIDLAPSSFSADTREAYDDAGGNEPSQQNITRVVLRLPAGNGHAFSLADTTSMPAMQESLVSGHFEVASIVHHGSRTVVPSYINSNGLLVDAFQSAPWYEVKLKEVSTKADQPRPDPSWIATTPEYVAYFVGPLVNPEKLTKSFSDTEPRDASGRWTSGSGGTGGSAPTMGGEAAQQSSSSDSAETTTVHGVGVTNNPLSLKVLTPKQQPGETASAYNDRLFRDGQEHYEPAHEVEAAAAAYRASQGLPEPKGISDWTTIEANVDRMKLVGDAFAAAKSDPKDPKVRAAYAELVRQVGVQWKLLTDPVEKGGLGVKVDFVSPQEIKDKYGDPDGYNPYNTAKEQRDDVVETHHLAIASLADYPDAAHPLLDSSRGGSYDKFRAVHDAFGHTAVGADFTRHGEWQAWLHHCSMFTGDARIAASTELTGENSFLVSRHTAAPHKAALLPSNLIAMPWDAEGNLNQNAWKDSDTE